MGTPKYIESPDKLWELFEQYELNVKTKPFLVDDWVGGAGIKVTRKKERPLTLEGFKNYCRRNVGCVNQYFNNADKRYNDYITICHAIRDEIRQEQIEGGMAGMYNPSITQRLNGLKEQTETTNIEQPLFGDDKK